MSGSKSVQRELQFLRDFTVDAFGGQTLPFLLRLLNEFKIRGPNGKHICIVTELLGPNFSELVDSKVFQGHRLPAKWAKSTAKQLLVALFHLHEGGLGHGGRCYNKRMHIKEAN